jgi:peptide/nickel transport system substrate-binding protein
MRKAIERVLWTAVMMAVVSACAPTSPGGTPSSTTAAAPPAERTALRTLTIAQANAIKLYGPWEFSSTPGGGASLAELHTAGLLSEDLNGNPEPRVAASLPSFDDGTIVVLPDGRMRTTWKLRPGVLWHDSVPFSAEDVRFSWQIAREPELVSSIEPAIRFAEAVDVVDALTVDMVWPGTIYRALQLGHRNAWLFPKHVLAEAFEGDKQLLLSQPFFTTEYVHLGPYRVADFGFGERQVLERFDGYFLGRQKIDTIIIHTISDPNVVLASLKAGSIDMVSEKVLSSDVAVQLRDEWRVTGEGTLVERQDNWLRAGIQFDPQWSQPLEISRDAGVRRGLLYAIDRDALAQFILPGFAETSADTFMLQRDPRSQTVGQPFARYRFDRSRALQEVADSGWRRAGDGRMVRSTGEQVQIQVRGYQFVAKEVSVLGTSSVSLASTSRKSCPRRP